jgi:hypothetical protein
MRIHSLCQCTQDDQEEHKFSGLLTVRPGTQPYKVCLTVHTVRKNMRKRTCEQLETNIDSLKIRKLKELLTVRASVVIKCINSPTQEIVNTVLLYLHQHSEI